MPGHTGHTSPAFQSVGGISSWGVVPEGVTGVSGPWWPLRECGTGCAALGGRGRLRGVQTGASAGYSRGLGPRALLAGGLRYRTVEIQIRLRTNALHPEFGAT